jgi:NADH dehydrogenase (ubiquinone) 1 beta subcomplex subunit 7
VRRDQGFFFFFFFFQLSLLYLHGSQLTIKPREAQNATSEGTSHQSLPAKQTLRESSLRKPKPFLKAMEVEGSSKKMIATQAEMVEARVPLPYRDQCAHLLIPLNKCRQAELYLPWKCENERHSYEKCEYELVMERMLKMQKIREEEAKLKQQKQKQPLPLIPNTATAS